MLSENLKTRNWTDDRGKGIKVTMLIANKERGNKKKNRQEMVSSEISISRGFGGRD